MASLFLSKRMNTGRIEGETEVMITQQAPFSIIITVSGNVTCRNRAQTFEFTLPNLSPFEDSKLSTTSLEAPRKGSASLG